MSSRSPERNGCNGSSRAPAELAAPRMLRVQFRGQPYDWFNLEEMGDAIRSEDFANTLRENIVHYFSVPFDCQAICDEEGPLCTAMDFARALKAPHPTLQVSDMREMEPDAKERIAQKLALVTAEVSRCQRNLGAMGGGRPPQGLQPAGAWGGQPPQGERDDRLAQRPGERDDRPGQRPVSPWDANRGQSSAASLADRLGSAGAPSQSQLPSGQQQLPAQQCYGGPCGGPPMAPAGGLYPGMAGPSGGWPSGVDGGGQPSNALNRPAPVRHYDVGMRTGDCLEVQLTKNPNDRINSRFGFANVPATNGRALLITWTDPSGLLAAWNRDHPDKLIQEGDLIFAVNTATENVDDMRNELHNDAIRMLIQPGNAANSYASHCP